MPTARFCAVLMMSAVLLPTVAPAENTAPPFAEGDVVGLIGDSITHGRKWHRYVYAYYLTRFPDRKVRFVNLGIAGDSAGGALRRLDWDILPHGLNQAVIFLGMNDVGRGYYAPNPTEQALAGQRTALTNYRNNMNQLSQKLIAAGVQGLVYCTPSPFDDTGDLGPNFPGVNAALAQCGQYGRELAATYHGGVVDLNGPMTAINLEHQKTDPKFTVIGPDRVHPGEVGMMVIAYLFLKAQGMPALVSRVCLDAKGVREAVNAEVSNLQATELGLEFDCRENALPWPIEAGAKPALELVPLERELNQEQLVASVPPGTYRLLIDGQEVGQYTAEALGAGINLALNDQTPQVRQALQVWQIAEQRANLEVRLRTHAQMRTVLTAKQVDESDAAAVDACFADFMARVGESMRPYFTNQINVYRQVQGSRDEIRRQMDDLQQKLWQLNQPTAHHFALVRVP
jgi:lysophospholipase L1-like esterase